MLKDNYSKKFDKFPWEKNSEFLNSLPEPAKIKGFLSKECLKKPSCELNFVDKNNDMKIKIILRYVQI